jgi:ketosteroid isomerase-like protein
MAEHPNVAWTRRGYEAFAKADLATLSELLAGDASWHVLGIGPLSGSYHGRDEIFTFFARRCRRLHPRLRRAGRGVHGGGEAGPVWAGRWGGRQDPR